jgi:SAM-dependent methyltransferase
MATPAITDTNLDEARRAAVTEWEAMAPGWERRREYLRDFSQGVTDWLVTELRPQPGQTILELAAGPGDPGFAAARIIGASGHLISTDVAPAMVEVAKRRARELGVSNVEFDVIDATRTGLPSASVDGIVCRWGYSLIPDVTAAFVESRRVLRPGGRLALSVMAGPAENPWAAGVAGALIGLGLIPPIDPRAPGGLFSLADHTGLRAMLTGAGFNNVRIENMEFHLRFPDFDDYWHFILEFAGAVAILLNSFSAEQREAVRAATENGAEAFRNDRGFDFPGLTVNVVAS